MADVMDDESPQGQRERLWPLIDNTPNLICQLLTKRPQPYSRFLPGSFKHGNVWLETNAEDQIRYDLRWPFLADAAGQRSLVSFIRYEPAIGPLSILPPSGEYGVPDWLIFGGESGSNRRPMQIEWAERIKDECSGEGVAFFMKQMSARTPDEAKKLIPAHLLFNSFPAIA